MTVFSRFLKLQNVELIISLGISWNAIVIVAFKLSIFSFSGCQDSMGVSSGDLAGQRMLSSVSGGFSDYKFSDGKFSNTILPTANFPTHIFRRQIFRQLYFPTTTFSDGQIFRRTNFPTDTFSEKLIYTFNIDTCNALYLSCKHINL